MAAPKRQPQPSSASQHHGLDGQALFYMALLALQFGIQPILTRQYTPQDISRSTVVLTQEVVKFGIAVGMLYLTTQGKPVESAMKGWTILSWIQVALVPAALYAVQNLAALMAYQNLDALTFNVLNQTKTLSAALCCYLIMGRTQSKLQVLSLMMLLLSALIMEKIVKVDDLGTYLSADYWNQSTDSESDDDTTTKGTAEWDMDHITTGVAPVLLASFLSGLAGALSQMNLQKAGGGSGGGRNSYLFSAELCVASILILGGSLAVSPDGTKILEHGFFHGWTIQTWIPIVTNALGGIIVGLVTKYAGSVRKGFALIFGILLSGLMQAALQPETGVTKEQILGGLLAGVSLYLHATNPPVKAPPSAGLATSINSAAANAAATKTVKQD